MTETLATPSDYKPLYALFGEIDRLAPWNWMEEIDLFGVQDPDTQEIGFVSVMGMAGERFAIGVYRGAEGLYGFHALQDQGPYLNPELLLNTPQLQASFEDREMLEKADRDVIKALGLKYRGRNAWPQFRSFRRGYAPWYLTSDEARFLTHVLGQVLEVAPRLRETPELLDVGRARDYLVRVAEPTESGLQWRDAVMEIDPPTPMELTIKLEPGLYDAVTKLPKKRLKVELDVFMSLMAVGERHERPSYPYMLLMVEAESGYPIGVELLTPTGSVEQLWNESVNVIFQQFMKLGALPSEIHVNNDLLFGIFQAFGKQSKVKVKQVDWLPALEQARAGIESLMGI